jgi:hypothetical protein
MAQLNLDDILQGASFTLTPPEPDDVRQSRLRREEADATLRRWTNFVAFCLAASLLVGVSVLCGYVVLQADDLEMRRNAMTGLFSIISAVAGFFVGQKIPYE